MNSRCAAPNWLPDLCRGPMFEEKNSVYLIAGYAVFFSGLGIYLLSLLIRRNNLRRDEKLMIEISEQMKLDEQPAQEH